MLIAFCGIDGAGKTTQINLLKDYLVDKGENVYLTKQPTNFYRQYDRFRDFVEGKISESDSLILNELALLSSADKLRHYETELKPQLNNIIISDRYVYSGFAYFVGRGITDIEWLKNIFVLVPSPDVTVYIDIPPEVALGRIIKRDGKYTKKEETDVIRLAKVRDCFLAQPWGKSETFHIVDGMQNVSSLHEQIKGIIMNYGLT